MPCYRPVTCWKPEDGGAISFHEIKAGREIRINCGQCIGCRISKQSAWVMRCYAESREHKRSIFATLTYDDDNLNPRQELEYKDFQLFLKRLRKSAGKRRASPFRFFVAGEYGERTNRPHWHALLFGYDPVDSVRYSSVYSKHPLFTSQELSEAWGKGLATFGEVNEQTIRYTAGYIVNRHSAESERYIRVCPETGETWSVVPEFARMSLKPGIGAEWLRKYYKDIYQAHDGVYINNRKNPIPRYFEELMEKIDPVMLEDSKARRIERIRWEDQTRERLEVREKVAKGRKKLNEARSQGYEI